MKEQRKESGKSKNSAGQQNLNTIMYEVGSSPPHCFNRLELTLYACGVTFTIP